jgi:hypothetical protein
VGVESTAGALPLLLLNTTRNRSGPPSTRATITAAATAQHNAQALRTPKHGEQI